MPSAVGQRERRARCPVASWWTAIRPGTPLPSVNWRRTRWPGPLGAIMTTSTSGGGTICPKWMLKPCANISSRAGAEVGRDLVAVDAGLDVVGHQHHDDVGLGGGVGDRLDGEPSAAAAAMPASRAARRPRPSCPTPAGSARGRDPGCRSRSRRSSCRTGPRDRNRIRSRSLHVVSLMRRRASFVRLQAHRRGRGRSGRCAPAR